MSSEVTVLKTETYVLRNGEGLEQNLSTINNQAQNKKTKESGQTKNFKNNIRSKFINKEDQLSSKMFTYARETICFFLALAFTVFAAMHNSPPRVSRPPLAKPFFNESSVVLDYFKGHLGALIERVSESDFTFVMYYAPWDAESQATKEEFEIAARYFHSQVFFAAINCWHPSSECRSRYNKIQSYPVLMFYPSRQSGLQYKGIKIAPYMIRFVKQFMNPVVRVTKDEELMQLMSSHDAVVIGYFNFTGLSKSPGYKEFYKAAQKSLERDPNGEIVYTAITSINMASDHGVVKFPSASLLMWNETLFYPDDKEWNRDNLNAWASDSIHRVVTWLQPPGTKSLTLAPYLWDGPVLFLFTPRNPLHKENHNYNLLKEIGLQYYDCTGNMQVQDLTNRLKTKRINATTNMFEEKEWCSHFLEDEEAKESFLVNSIRKQRETSNSDTKCCSKIPTNKCNSCPKRKLHTNNVCVIPGNSVKGACKNIDIFYTPFLSEDRYNYQEYPFNLEIDVKKDYCFFKECTESNEIDHYSTISIQKSFYKEACREYLSAYSYQKPLFPTEYDQEIVETNLTSSICEINKTLALVAIDSLYYFHFAESLGINIDAIKEKQVVVILDPAEESQFVMQEEYGRNSLVNFINNYTEGLLQRSLRSIDPRKFVHKRSIKDNCVSNFKTTVCLKELNTSSFLTTVLNPEKDVVVMYHTPYCAFCSAVSYVYLSVAHYLSKMDHLEFVRIDGDNNDLPWEYTMNKYPSVLFFPAKSKADSTIFPSNLPISVANLLNFILANLNEESHVEALINICSAGVGGPPLDCVHRIRRLSLDVIEKYLKDFRKINRRQSSLDKQTYLNLRKRLLIKLEHFRDIHLILSSTNDLFKDKSKVKLLRAKYKKLYHLLNDSIRVDRNNYASREGAKNSKVFSNDFNEIS